MTQSPETPAYRSANRSDIPFLAQIAYQATLPPLGKSFWDDLPQGTETETDAFLRAMFQNEASNWGNVADFIVLEAEGEPAAACSVFRPGLTADTEAPFDLARLEFVASSLEWSHKKADRFRKMFKTAWGDGDASFLTPQADLIIENLSVAPDHRGKGLGTALIKASFDRGRRLEAQSIGIMVIHGNDAAQALYERFFDPYITFHAEYFDHAIQGVTKYRKSLMDQSDERKN